MEVMVFEIRDRGTHFGAVAIRLGSVHFAEYRELAHAGYGMDPEDQKRHVLFVPLTKDRWYYDPHSWADRTCQVAHRYIKNHWDDLTPGQVIDVQYILRETEAPKVSENADR